MLTKNIKFKNFLKKFKNQKVKKDFKLFIKESFLEKNHLLSSLTEKYNYTYTKKKILPFKKFSSFRIIGIGGSILGTRAIYQFLKHKIKKNFFFIDNLQIEKFFIKEKNIANIIISKSGNTLETIANSNILINKKNKNIFITENKDSYLRDLANKLKAEIIEHKNFIGGRYSVLSEVGMLPAELMGLNEKNFKQLNYLIKDKKFVNSLIRNVENTIYFLNRDKFTSVILNYDEKSCSLFKWYQQLIAESLGKKSKGILPIVSSMPKDNHSLMQFYLDGPQKSFFTFFYVFNKNSNKIKNKSILKNQKYLKNKTMSEILYAQKLATENVFFKKNIPFRSFEIYSRDEKSLGELFCFFILETILLGRALKVNPFDQPSVELIKKETKKILIKV